MALPLHRDRILRVALELLDAEGPDGVSMRRVAAGLGVTPMALYRHVPDKRALLDGIAELVAAGVPSVPGGWDERVRGVAYGLRDACRAHPAAVPLLQSTRSMAPPLLAPMETVLAALAEAGLDDDDALAAWSALVGLTLGHVQYELGGHARGLDFDRAFATALDALVAGWRVRARPPVHAELPGATLRRATPADVGAIVALLAADQLGASRDGGPDLAPYERAFAALDADPAQLLVCAAAPGGDVVGTLQLSFIPGLARRGGLRAQIEAVRVREDLRGRGLGAALFAWAIGEARRRGCALVQLTTDKRRADAHRFYERLGFTASHEGFKLTL